MKCKTDIQKLREYDKKCVKKLQKILSDSKLRDSFKIMFARDVLINYEIEKTEGMK
jgi:hypothetical protein